MRRAGVDVDCRVWDGLWHVFEFYGAYPEADESLREIANFLRSQLATQQS
jgi:acetyl esterase/lipase